MKVTAERNFNRKRAAQVEACLTTGATRPGGVTIYLSNPDEGGLCVWMSPNDARELAASLLRQADFCDS